MESLTTAKIYDFRDGEIVRCNLIPTFTEVELLIVQPVSSLYDFVTETHSDFSHPVTVLKGKKLTWWPVSNLPTE
jgi:hypothetical protein